MGAAIGQRSAPGDILTGSSSPEARGDSLERSWDGRARRVAKASRRHSTARKSASAFSAFGCPSDFEGKRALAIVAL